MKELERLVNGPTTEAERSLLLAARAHRPPTDDARARTHAAVASGLAAGALLATGAGSKSAGLLASKVVSRAILKWLAVLTLGGGALGVGVVVVASRGAARLRPAAPSVAAMESRSHSGSPSPDESATPQPEPTPLAVVRTMAPPASPVVATQPSGAEPLATATASPRPEQVPSATAAPSSPPSSPPSTVQKSESIASQVAEGSSGGQAWGGGGASGPPTVPSAAATPLSSEIRLLDEARASLTAHDPDNALVALDRYATVFPAGVFTPESRVLRVEALLQKGDRAAAVKLASALLGHDPGGPYAERVRKMIEK